MQTSYGCLKVSEFYQESDSEDKNFLRQEQSENKLLCFCEFLSKATLIPEPEKIGASD